MPRPEFYLRYYVGHRGKFGHEFMEFEFASTGKLRYANNSNYKNDSMIRKEVTVSDAVLDEIERIITDAEITKEDDADWPEPIELEGRSSRSFRTASTSPSPAPRLSRC